MAIDRAKILESAQKYLSKGQIDKAIGEYMKLVKAEPEDVRTWLKIGDLHVRKSATRDAVDVYTKVAELYAKDGYYLKAVAVFKQILKLEPSRMEAYVRLAEMYELLALTSDALSTLETVDLMQMQNGQSERALATLQRMVELDSNNVPVRIKFAEALSKEGRVDQAAEALERAADLLEQQGRTDDYIKVAERLLFHRQDDTAIAKKLARLYVERNDPKHALGKLQVCFKADPRDIETLELLAAAFDQLGQTPKTVSVYKEIARLHQEAGEHEARAIALKRVLDLDPTDVEARQALAGFAPSQSGRLPSDMEPPPGAVVDGSQAGAEVYEDDEGGERPEPSRTSIPPEVAREAQIARLMTECDVFMRYGLKSKVIDQLKRVLDIDPAYVPAREKLKDTFAAAGRTDDAIEQLFALAELVEASVAEAYLREILEVDPANARAREWLDHLGVSLDELPEPDEELVFVSDRPAPAEEEALEVLDDADLLQSLPPEEGASTSARAPAMPPPAALPDAMAVESNAFDDREGTLTQPQPTGWDEPVSPFAAAPSLVVAPPDPARSAPLSAPAVGGLPASKRPSLRPSQRAGPPKNAAELEELLDESEFFLAQGLFDEARSMLFDALVAYPGHPLVQEKMAELDELEAQAEAQAQAVAPQASAPPETDESFLLAEKLAEELASELGNEPATSSPGSGALDLDQVFAQFKKGVESTIGIEDSDTHFDLGIAYKEMGLLDDAIHEFELSMSNPSRVCIAHTMIGLCHLEKGAIDDAIHQFKKGLFSDTKTEQEELGLLFELGNAYELLGDLQEAIYYFQKVQKRDPSFRSVGERLQAVASPRPPPAILSAPAPNSADVDAAFDDLLGEEPASRTRDTPANPFDLDDDPDTTA